MTHIFISYEHRSSDFVRVLSANLEDPENGGYETWWDQNITGGQEWRKEIDEAIRTAFVMIIIMTPEARLSEYVTYEWALAIGLGIPVIPILYGETELHPRLEIHQYFDFTDVRIRPWKNLYTRLRNIAAGDLSGEPTLNGDSDDDAETLYHRRLVEVLGEMYYSGLINMRTLSMFLTRDLITTGDLKLLREAAENRTMPQNDTYHG